VIIPAAAGDWRNVVPQEITLTRQNVPSGRSHFQIPVFSSRQRGPIFYSRELAWLPESRRECNRYSQGNRALAWYTQSLQLAHQPLTSSLVGDAVPVQIATFDTAEHFAPWRQVHNRTLLVYSFHAFGSSDYLQLIRVAGRQLMGANGKTVFGHYHWPGHRLGLLGGVFGTAGIAKMACFPPYRGRSGGYD